MGKTSKTSTKGMTGDVDMAGVVVVKGGHGGDGMARSGGFSLVRV